MKLQPGTGIEETVRFGMSRVDIEHLYGKADRIVKLDDDSDDEQRIEYQYNKLKTSFRFYPDKEYRLAWIETENTSIELYQNKLIGLTKYEVIDLLSENGNSEFEHDEYDSFETIYYSDICLELQLTYDVVTRVNSGAYVNDQNEYAWKN